MPTTTARSANETVSSAINRSALMAGHRPVPLVSTAYDIQISGGLAAVVARRTFRNAETASIEATLTFPLPVHAVLYELEARIGDRVLKAKAQAKSDARAQYEEAIDSGKTAVLHEELIRGVHLLSVGHIAPGTEIEVTSRLALSLSHVAGRVYLRLPTTVGDVYGSSGLPDSDELIHGGPILAAEVAVRCDCGQARLVGASLADGRATVALDAPIVIEVKDWQPRALLGSAADGRSVRLDIEPSPRGTGAIDAAVLVDHSGSMNGACAGGAGIAKHAAALLGLSDAGADLVAGDRLHLWEFDDTVRDLGRTDAKGWRTLLTSLSGPHGGTQIGTAMAAVIAGSLARDVLLVTDGKSYAIDVQALAREARRVTVVLIGEDSLDANVGHLAVLTGGDIFVPDGADVAGAVRSALQAIRLSGDPREMRLRCGGMALAARWQAKEPSAKTDEAMSRAVAAFSASLLLPSVGEAEARRIAQSEGLVTHLTSLILVDEHGAVHDGLPAFRKVALPSPRMLAAASDNYRSMRAMGISPSFASWSKAVYCEARPQRRPAASARIGALLPWQPSPVRQPSAPSPAAPPPRQIEPRRSPAVDLARVARKIDWSSLGATLATGSLVGADEDVVELLRQASELTPVRKAAKRVGVSALMLVIGLLARAAAAHDRHADRVARAILGKALPKHLKRAADRLGLPCEQVLVA